MVVIVSYFRPLRCCCCFCTLKHYHRFSIVSDRGGRLAASLSILLSLAVLVPVLAGNM